MCDVGGTHGRRTCLDDLGGGVGRGLGVDDAGGGLGGCVGREACVMAVHCDNNAKIQRAKKQTSSVFNLITKQTTFIAGLYRLACIRSESDEKESDLSDHKRR